MQGNMAKIQPLRDLSGLITSYKPSSPVRKLIQWSLDSRRLLILAPKPIKKGDDYRRSIENKIAINSEKPIGKSKNNIEVENYMNIIVGENNDNSAARYMSVDVPKSKNPSSFNQVNDGVVIVVMQDWGNMKAFDEIRLPFIPSELEYNTDSAFTAIRPIGSNTAKYHYTGSEDRLEFEIDWHSFEEGREDVVTNCRKIESLSKGDAYNNPPPSVLLIWGQNNLLFADHEFIIISAPYRFTQFSKSHLSNGVIRNTHLMPIQAMQKVTLARISSNNLTSKDIQYSSNY